MNRRTNPFGLMAHAHFYVEYGCRLIFRTIRVQPVGIGLFAGRLQYRNLPLLTRLFFWLQSRLPSGDFRNWSTIQTWVREIRPALVSS